MQKITPILLLTIVLYACQAPETSTPAPSRATATPSPTVAPTPTTFVPPRGGDFREARASDAVSFHPYLTTDATSRIYQDKVFASGLWLRDPRTLQPIPGMAESWTVSSDGKTYTFSLRRDLKWSDGAPLTAHDFVWTFVQAAKPENQYPYIEGLANIASYIAKDDWTLEITLKEATCTALLNVDVITPLPQHIWSKLDWRDPSKNPEIHFPSVVSGAYKVKEWQRGDHITFIRNDLYYRGAPHFDSYTIRIVPDANKQFQMLQAGEIDTAPVTPADFAKARQIEHLALYEWAPAAPEWEFIGLNLRRPFLKNAVVRQALAHAVPRDAIAAQIFHNLAKPTYSIFPPTMSVFASDVPRYEYNLDTAKSLLQKAGYKLNASGRLVDSANNPVPKLRILYNVNNKTREQVGAVLQAQLKTLGIESELLYADFATYVNYLRQEPFDFDMFLLGWRTPIEPYLSFQMWTEINIPRLNLSAYVNPEVERLFAQTNKPPCVDETRKQAFAQIQKIIATDVPYIFLVYHTGYAFVHKRVVPNPPSPLGIDYFPEQWFMTNR
ncbi:MAG: ABC transporter substrate-binding protein [Anaerolineae bacterium]|nr:ABC transporter substrate-binding protein [Anaerolineae bacterium]